MSRLNRVFSAQFFCKLSRRAAYSKNGMTFYSYRHFRENFHHEIAEDCFKRCVYCDSHEDEMGGRELMQIDHFRPYTRTEFSTLKDDPSNFNHSCGRCNSLKSDKWPSSRPDASHDGVVGFVDPFLEDRQQYFSLGADGGLISLKPIGQYLIETLALNRPHLKNLRLKRVYVVLCKEHMAKRLPVWEAACKEGDIPIELVREMAAFIRIMGQGFLPN